MDVAVGEWLSGRCTKPGFGGGLGVKVMVSDLLSQGHDVRPTFKLIRVDSRPLRWKIGSRSLPTTSEHSLCNVPHCKKVATEH